MNEKNLEYLKTQLKYLGFGDKLSDVLRSALLANSGDFPLSLKTTPNPYRFRPKDAELPLANETMRYNLQFKQGSETNIHFLNNMHAALFTPGSEPVARQFNPDSAYHVTAMDAYNLLSGRYVEKKINLQPAQEGGTAETKTLWLGLDLEVTNHRGQHPFKTFHEQYGYDLEKTVAKYQASGFESAKEAEARLQALRKGHLVATTIPLAKKQTPVWIAANPERGLNVYHLATMKAIHNFDIFPEMKKAYEEKRAAEQAAAAEASASAALAPDLDPVAQAEGRSKGARR